MEPKARRHISENAVQRQHALKQDIRLPLTQRAALGDVGNRQQVALPKGLKKDKEAKLPVPLVNNILKARNPIRNAPAPMKQLTATITAPTKVAVNNVKVKNGSNDVDIAKFKVLQQTSSTVAIIKPPARNILKNRYEIDNESDPQMVAEYIEDIVKYWMQLERKLAIKKSFLKDYHVTKKMRCVLVNWMVEICDSFKFARETFIMSVSLLDRYLQANRNVTKDTFQMVGTSAVLIAAKYEEIFIPDTCDYIYICDNSFTSKELFRCERDMLSRLEFNLGRPLSIHFLRRYNKVISATMKQHIIGKYITELALLEYELCHVKPSLQAAAACCLGRYLTHDQWRIEEAWSDLLVHHTGYKFANIIALVYEFAAMLINAEKSNYQELRRVYSTSKQACISSSDLLRGAKVKALAAKAKVLQVNA